MAIRCEIQSIKHHRTSGKYLTMNNRSLKTPLAYYGGKQAIISHILPLIPHHEVYTEVFFGGGTVFFAKNPATNETINDRFDLIINFYRVLKNNYKSLKKRIDQTLLSRYDFLEAKKILKKWNSSLINKPGRIDAAWATWFIFNFSNNNKLGGGLKFFNATCGAMPDILNNKKHRFTEHLVERLKHATIENREAIKVLKSRNTVNAFHSIDPPYLGANQGHYSGYEDNDLIDLLDWCQTECKGKFLLHNYNSKILTDYIEKNNWHKKEIITNRTSPYKTEIKNCEVMVYNYDLMPRLFG